MPVTSTLRTLEFENAVELVDAGAVFIDLRPTDDYLEVHVPGAISIVYEAGPGMATRARDCIPLDVPLVLIADDHADVSHAAASLRGKGFTVAGVVGDAVNGWVSTGGRPASTEIATGREAPKGTPLDVADPAARVPADTVRVPADILWQNAEYLADEEKIVLVAGYGVRAGLSVGILERAGVKEIVFWKTRA